ncbi:MAG: adenylosuccinate synthetase [bacterium]
MKTVKKAHIVVGLGYGDEGKGTMTDFLCRYHKANLVVRFNGGPQAGHNVVMSDKTHHKFSQIGSATFVPGVATLISKHMFWDPIVLACEVQTLSEKIKRHALNNHYIDGAAPIVTPFHMVSNRVKEWCRGEGRHGSCGMGFGEAVLDSLIYSEHVLRASDLQNTSRVERVLSEIQMRKQAELNTLGFDLEKIAKNAAELGKIISDPNLPAYYAETYSQLAKEFNILKASEVNRLIYHASGIVFEGAQGMLLDEWYGFHPYTTWSTVGPDKAMSILDEAGFSGDREMVGVIRAYATRHGAGPFVTEDESMDGFYPNEHNCFNQFQDSFRIGWFDGIMFRYALACAAKDRIQTSIAVTHLDAIKRNGGIKFCGEYVSPIVSGSKDLFLGRYLQKGFNTVVDICPEFTHCLERQGRMTEFLQGCRPVENGMFTSDAELLDCLYGKCNANIKYLSYGPTPEDKKVL